MEWTREIVIPDSETQNASKDKVVAASTQEATSENQGNPENLHRMSVSPPVNKGKRVATNNLGKHSQTKKSKPSKTKSTNLALVEIPHTVDDNYVHREHIPAPETMTTTQKLIQALTFSGQVRSTDDTNIALQELLEAKDRELDRVTCNLAKITSENDQLKAEVANLKRELDSHLLDNAKSRLRLIEFYQKKVGDCYTEGVMEGIERCRKRIFRTAAGQNFLKTLHEGFLDAYHLSSMYLKNMGPHIGHFVLHGFNAAETQAQAKGFKGKLDSTSATNGLKASPAFKGDKKLPVNHPWWLPVMRKAVQDLATVTINDPSLFPAKEILYNIDAPESSFGLNILDHQRDLPATSDTPPQNLEK